MQMSFENFFKVICIYTDTLNFKVSVQTPTMEFKQEIGFFNSNPVKMFLMDKSSIRYNPVEKKPARNHTKPLEAA